MLGPEQGCYGATVDTKEVFRMKIAYCKRCLTPNTRPRVVLDSLGVCNACNYATEKPSIDWQTRKEEFLRICDTHRSKNGYYDCVVPWSGGKDSSAIAYRLKFEYGMNPLLATYSPLIPNEVGMANRESLIRAGFDQVTVRPDQRVGRHLARRFFIERGNQKVAWDAGISTVPVQIALNYGIPLVFYAEHGETEYGGRVIHEESSKIRDWTEVLENAIGDDPVNWVDEVVTLNNLNPYRYPPLKRVQELGLRAYYFGYFFRWDMYENYKYISSKIPFLTDPHGRTEGTFTDFDSLDDKQDTLYYYMCFIKFGFGRAIRDASRMIQNGHITRDQGLEYARLYDQEYPARYLKENLEYLSLSEDEFRKIVDQHRNPEIWEKAGGEWRLRYPPE